MSGTELAKASASSYAPEAEGESTAPPRTWLVAVSTRTPTTDDDRSSRVAGSVHLALGASPIALSPLNGDRGVVFAQAVPSHSEGVRETRTLRDPALCRGRDGAGYWLVAVRTLPDGTPDPTGTGSLLVFRSVDLITYDELGLLPVDVEDLNEPHVSVHATGDRYIITWRTAAGEWRRTTRTELDPLAGDGDVPSHVQVAPADAPPLAADRLLSVDPGTAAALERRFGRVRNVRVTVADLEVRPGETVDLTRVRAILEYSDGSVAERPIDWDPQTVVDPSAGCEVYEFWGTVRQHRLAFPFVWRRADPCIVRHEGHWYFIATDDTGGDNVHSTHLTIRVASTLEALADADEHVILTTGDEAGIRGCFWAPELHVVAGVLTVFFSPSVGAADWSHVRSHVLQLRPGGDPIDPTHWGLPRELKQQDGAPLQLADEHPGISLDMTYTESGGRSYVAWSQRSLDDVAPEPDIWIATIDPAVPDRLTSRPVRLLAPLYGWERNSAPVAEGPYVVRHGSDLWMTYSASGVGPTYAAGVLHASFGADLTDPSAWTRTMPAALASDPAIGQWGPGHNTFVTDDDGQTLLVYHAKVSPTEPERHTGVRPVHWAADGRPVLDMAPDEEVAPSCRRVRLHVVVRDAEPGAAEAGPRTHTEGRTST